MKMTSISYSYDGLKLLAFCSNGRIYCWSVLNKYELIAIGSASKEGMICGSFLSVHGCKFSESFVCLSSDGCL